MRYIRVNGCRKVEVGMLMADCRRIILEDMLKNIEYTVVKGSDKIQVRALCYDTRDMRADSVYVCIKGNSYDGHRMVQEAIYKGAIALVVEDDVDTDDNITVIKVRSSRHALAHMSAAFFGYPARDMVTIGITGTKGKTTTAYMIGNILKAAGYNPGIIGSIEVRYGNVTLVNENTTPESYRIHELLYNMRLRGVDIVVMEVSSQALKMERVEGIEFDYGVYTNMSEDHIGPAEHKDMEEYVSCKSKLFSQCRTAVFNINDSYVNTMLENCTTDVRLYYGVDGEASYADNIGSGGIMRGNTITLTDIDGLPGTRYTLLSPRGIRRTITLKLPGEYSVYNSLAAITVCDNIIADGTDEKVYELVSRVLAEFTVKGRMEVIDSGRGYTVIVDYAHNELSLQCLLQSLREYTKGKLICLFGCGGNRSKTRRYKMGEVSARYADVTIVTDDNPRYEPAEDIRSDIECGINKVIGRNRCTDFKGEFVSKTYILQPDREKAIQNALSKAGKDDMIVIAGKGHENYQEIKGVRYPLNDTEIVKNILQWNGGRYGTDKY